MPWGKWLTGLDRRRFMALSIRLNLGLGNQEVHKGLLRLLLKASYADKGQAPIVPIAAGDRWRPAPMRDAWPCAGLRLDLCRRLAEIRALALACVGRFDPQAPVACSEELVRGIRGADLEIFPCLPKGQNGRRSQY
jgi:hypothetical protein